jgi:hypothetical protein
MRALRVRSLLLVFSLLHNMFPNEADGELISVTAPRVFGEKSSVWWGEGENSGVPGRTRTNRLMIASGVCPQAEQIPHYEHANRKVLL